MNIFFLRAENKNFHLNINFVAQFPAPSTQLPGATAPFASPLDTPLVTAFHNHN